MTSQQLTRNICFLGGGSMAEAIIRGITSKQIVPLKHISVTNQSDWDRLSQLKQSYGIQVPANDQEKLSFAQQADILILAMKPKDAGHALKSLIPYIQPKQLIISVIAGLRIETIQHVLKQNIPVARTMPNTSSTIGQGATGICFSSEANESQIEAAKTIFASIGVVSEVDESKMDIVTGVSGSGPAYIYYMMEAMIEAGLQGGLDAETAKALSVQTILGAAKMVQTTNENPADLRRKVTSPGGTTEAAIEMLTENEFQGIVIKAIHRAKERAGELGDAITASMEE